MDVQSSCGLGYVLRSKYSIAKHDKSTFSLPSFCVEHIVSLRLKAPSTPCFDGRLSMLGSNPGNIDWRRAYKCLGTIHGVLEREKKTQQDST